MGKVISSMNKYWATFLWASFFPFVWWGCYLFQRLFDKMNVWIIIGSQQKTPTSVVVVLVIVIIKCYHPTCPFYGWREWSLKNRGDLSLSLCIGYLPLAPLVTSLSCFFFQGPTSTHDIDRGPVSGQFPPAGRANRRWEEWGEWEAFLSLTPSQVSITGRESLWKTTGTPKVADSTRFSQARTLKLLPPLDPSGRRTITSWLLPALNCWIAIPLWKLLIRFWVLLMDTDNSKRQKW